MSDYHLNGWSAELDRQDELKRRSIMKEPCMCGDPACGICGPLQGYDYEDDYDKLRREDEQYRRRLELDLGMMIKHIAEHNSFDKQDLILLLKRARTWISNATIET